MSISNPTFSSISTDSGTSATDFKTNDQTLTFTIGVSNSGTGSTTWLGLYIRTVGSSTWTLISTHDYAVAGTSFGFIDANTLAAGNYEIGWKTGNSSGNAANGSGVTAFGQTVTIDITAAIAIDAISGDDFINATEHGQSLTISGTTTSVDAGQTVSVVLNGVTHTGTVQANGTWQVTYSSGEVSALSNGTTYTVAASVTDIEANAASANRAVTIDTSPPAIPSTPDLALASDSGTFNDDNITNVTTPTFTGTADAGTTVTIYSDGVAVGSGVATGGNYSIAVSTLSAGTHSITAKATDAAGNISNTSSDLSVTIDTSADEGAAATLTVGDTLVSNAEKTAVSYTVTNLDADATAVVTVTDGVHSAQHTFSTGGSFAFNLTGFNDGTVSSSMTITDTAGNSTLVTGQNTTLDTVATASISIDAITPDDVINASEAAGNVAVTGTVGGDVADSDTITLTVNGNDYTGTSSGGAFSISVAGSDLAADSNVHVSVTAHDAAGNSATATDDHSYTVDTTADAGGDLSVSVGDHLVNNSEKSAVAYTVNGLDADATATVTFSDGATSVTGSGGIADLSSLSDGPVSVSVSATDTAGNTANGAGDSLTLDTTADAGADLSVSVSDHLVNNSERSAVGYTVNGLDGDAVATVTFSDGSTTVTGAGGVADLSTLNDGPISVSISATDTAGNTANGAGDSLTLDTTADASGDLSVSVSDHLVNNSEKSAVAYTVDGLDGDAIATITFSDGSSSVTGSGGVADLSTLGDGPITVSISATDTAGNTANGAGDSLTLDTTADAGGDLSVSVGDHLVNNGEKSAVGYTVNGLDADAIATVTFSDGSTSVIGSGSVADLSSLSDGPITVSISATDTAGNTANGAGDSLTLDTTADTGGDLSISVGDHVVNNNEKSAVAYTVNGLDGDATPTVTFSDGATSVTGSGGVADLSTLSDGLISVSVSATDTAGNTANGTSDSLTLDTTADAGGDLSVSVSDHLVNNSEKSAVGYTVNGLDADASATVTFSDGATSVTGSGGVADLSTLSDGLISVSVSATDTAGNTANGTSDSLTLDTTADAGGDLSVSVSDHLVNNSEKSAVGYTVNGLDADASATVTFSDGSTSVIGSGSVADLSSLSDGPITVSISATDTAGNTANGAGDSLTLDTTADAGADLSVSVSDHLVNNGEKGAVAYTVNGVDVDATATVTFSDGSTAVTGTGGLADLSTLTDGPISVSISASDTAGNTANGVGDSLTLDTTADTAPAITLSVDDTADHVINNAESFTVSYTVAGLDPDATATLTFSDGTHPNVVVSVTANGTFNDANLSTLNGTVQSSLHITDSAGNTADANGNDVTLDTTADAAPTATVTINDGDGYINDAEKAAVSYTIAGVDADAAATLTFSDGVLGHNIVVSGLHNGTAAVDLHTLNDGPISVSIGLQDTHSNIASGTGDGSIKDTTADAGADASVTFSDGDGFVNASETPIASYTIAGVDADATATVTFSDGVSGHDIVVTGLSNGTASIDLSGLDDGPISASISMTDTALNTANGTGDTSVKDTVADAGADAAVTINDGDGFINNVEKGSVSYTVAGVDADATATVTFSDGTPAHDIVVSGLVNGTTTVDLHTLDDGPVTATISVTDNAQNGANGSGDNSVKDTTADAAPAASVTIDDGDGYINLSERSLVHYTIADVDGDANATVTFHSSGGGSDVVVSGLTDGAQTVDLSSLSDGMVTASISVGDTALNSTNGAGDSSILDATPPTAPSLVTLVLSDNGAGGTSLDLSGGTDSGTTVTVAGAGLGSLLTSGDAWSETVNPLAAGSHHIVVTAHDAADNTTSTAFDVNLVDATHVSIDLSNVGVGVPMVDTTGLPSGTDVTITGSNAGGDGIATGDGNDHITTNGASFVLAGAGNDDLHGVSDEGFYGEAGNDTITFTGSGSTASYYGDYVPTAGSTDRDYALEHTAANTWSITALTGGSHAETDVGTDTVIGADSLGFDGSGTALATADLITLLNNATGSVDENSSSGASVGITAHADDNLGAVHYALTDDDGGRFVIDASGVITTGATIIDRELDGASRQVTVRATADDGSFTEHTYTINVGDVNDNAPSFTTGDDFTIDENSAGGTAVTTAHATDADATSPNNTVIYSITGGTGLGKFDIDAGTGAVTVHSGAVLDREAAENYTIVVTATDGGTSPLHADQTVTIHLSDLNDNAPAFTSGDDFTIDENSAGSTAVTTVHADDADATSPNNTVSYSITGGTGLGKFDIDSGTGAVTVHSGAVLDREAAENYTIVVTATDGGTSPLHADQTVTVHLADLNDNAPSFTTGTSFNIDENSAGGTAVTAVHADDADATSPNNSVSYSITGGTGLGKFDIDSGTGAVTVHSGAVLDREAAENYTIVVTATDGGTSPLHTDQTVTVHLADLNDNAPSFTTGDDFTIDENAASASAVTTVHADDADATAPNSTVSYSITGGTGLGKFDIDSGTGAVTVHNAAVLDREAAENYTIVVTATDGGTSPLHTDQTVTVHLADLDDNAPSFTTGDDFTISENAGGGSAVTTVHADDADATSPNNVVSYSITGGTGAGKFDIDSSTGAVTVHNGAVLDREAAENYTLVVTATDGGTSPLHTDQTVTVHLADLNDNAPSFTTGDDFTINENAAGGSAVTTVHADDADATSPNNAVSYSITGGTGLGKFDIDSGTGAVTVHSGAVLDREAAENYTVVVTATDGGTSPLHTDQTVTVHLADLNDNAPAIQTNNAVHLNVDENSSGGTAVGSISATDADATAPNNTVSYAITGGSGAGLFDIDSATGAITVHSGALLDVETTPSYTVQVTASDGGSPQLSDVKTFTIDLNDLNDNAPNFTTATSFNIDENATGGTAVTAVHASDADVTSPNNTVSYAITGGTGLGKFDIDSGTGAVTVHSGAVLDREAAENYTLVVRATDGGTSPLHTDQTVTVHLNDVNDNAPVIQTNPAAHFHVDENSAGGSSVGSVSATDADATSPNKDVSYAITNGTGMGLFDIDSSTGAITVHSGAVLNFEGTSSYTVEVTASDGGATPLSDVKIFTVDLNNVNEAPVVATGQSLTPNENVQFVGSVAATDEDSLASGFHSIVYSLDVHASDNDLFTIDAGTGALNFVSSAGSDGADPLGTHGPDYVVDVRVSDGSNPSLTTHQTVAVHAQSIGAITNNGTTGNDTEYGTLSADTLNGNAGNDTIYGGAGADNIDGGSGNDTLYGGVGADTILGGSGNDKIYGGIGADMLSGGSGADQFVFNTPNEGTDTITDFLSGTSVLADKIALDKAGFGITTQTSNDLFTNGALTFHDGGLWWNGISGTATGIELAVVQHITHMSGTDVVLV